MQKSVDGRVNKTNNNCQWLPELDRLLIVGIKGGALAKHDAIKRILKLVPGSTRGDCWQRIRHLQKTPELLALKEHHPEEPKKSEERSRVRRPAARQWTFADDAKLADLAGYEPLKKIAQRLGRSVRAVRFRLGALGMTARVTDGWSLRSLRKMLHVSPARLRHLIGSGILRVRDRRITSGSLAAFCEKNCPSSDVLAIEKASVALAKGDDAFSWERSADLLGISIAEIRDLISAGQLRVVDTFVTDRSFEDFCKKHGDELNVALMDPATAKWLVSGYGVSESAFSSSTISRAQKHALAVRTCKCGRKIAGNAFFRHVNSCTAVMGDVKRKAG